MPLKYLILVLLLMDFFHTFILSEKTRFGYPFVVPYLVFFVGVFCNAPFSFPSLAKGCFPMARFILRGRMAGRPAGRWMPKAAKPGPFPRCKEQWKAKSATTVRKAPMPGKRIPA